MYPYEPFLNGDYSFQDLPDQIDFDFTWLNELPPFQGTLNKLEQPVTDDDGNTYYYKSTETFSSAPFFGGEDEWPVFFYIIFWSQHDGDRWTFTIGPADYPFQFPSFENTEGPDSLRSIRSSPNVASYPCSGLIGKWDNQTTLKDDFAQTYTVSSTGFASRTIARQISSIPDYSDGSIIIGGQFCTWVGEGFTLSLQGYEWKLNGIKKSGFQNTPIGSYAGFTIS